MAILLQKLLQHYNGHSQFSRISHLPRLLHQQLPLQPLQLIQLHFQNILNRICSSHHLSICDPCLAAYQEDRKEAGGSLQKNYLEYHYHHLLLPHCYYLDYVRAVQMLWSGRRVLLRKRPDSKVLEPCPFKLDHNARYPIYSRLDIRPPSVWNSLLHYQEETAVRRC